MNTMIGRQVLQSGRREARLFNQDSQETPIPYNLIEGNDQLAEYDPAQKEEQPKRDEIQEMLLKYQQSTMQGHALKTAIDFIKNKIQRRFGEFYMSQMQMISVQSDQEQEQVPSFQLKRSLSLQFNQQINHLNTLKDLLKINQKRSFVQTQLIKFLRKIALNLPINMYKSQIKSAISKNQVVLINGSTGCGKSTQLSQICLEIASVNKKIAVIEPKKSVTKLLANRVAFQQISAIGEVVGYKISNKQNKTSQKSKIIFMPDSVFLDEMIQDNSISEYSCVIIDEAHERNLFTDIILGLIKKSLSCRKDLKVIITTATMDQKLFTEYFAIKQVIRIPSRNHSISYVYRPCVYIEQAEEECLKILSKQIMVQDNQHIKEGALVFCQSIEQVFKMIKRLRLNKRQKQMYKVQALHGKVKPQELQVIFKNKQSNQKKIIFSTRIAETSLTIPGIGIVIDLGYDKESVYYQDRKLSVFQRVKITKAGADQRAGRTGRTNPGVCYRLYSQREYNQKAQNKSPQIMRTCLDTMILRMKKLGIRDVINFQYLTTPNLNSLKDSLISLRILGAIDGKEELTVIGQIMGRLPTQPYISRALIQALTIDRVRNCKQRQVTKAICSIMAMLLGKQSIFTTTTCPQIQQVFNKQGDFMTLLNMYQLAILIYKCKGLGGLDEGSINIQAFNEARKMYQIVYQSIQRGKFFNDLIDKQIKEIQKQKIKVLENQSIQESIERCFVNSLISNLAVYSGYEKMGYYLPFKQIYCLVSSQSVLSLFQDRPEFLLVNNIYYQNYNYCKFAQIVTKDKIKRYVDAELMKSLIKDFQQLLPTLKQFYFEKVPSIILKDLQRQMKLIDKFTYQTLFVDQKNNRIQFFGNVQFDLQQVVDNISTNITQLCQYRQKQVRTFRKSASVNAMIGAGMSCKEIRSDDSFEQVRIYFKKQLKIQQSLLVFLKQIFEGFSIQLLGDKIVIRFKQEQEGSNIIAELYNVLNKIKSIDQKQKDNFRRHMISRKKSCFSEFVNNQLLKQIMIKLDTSSQHLNHLYVMLQSCKIQKPNHKIIGTNCRVQLTYFLSHQLYATSFRRPQKTLLIYFNKNRKHVSQDYYTIRNYNYQKLNQFSIKGIELYKGGEGLFFDLQLGSNQFLIYTKMRQFANQHLAATGSHLHYSKGFAISIRRNRAYIYEIEKQKQNIVQVLQNRLKMAKPQVAFIKNIRGKIQAFVRFDDYSTLNRLKSMHDKDGYLGVQKAYCKIAYCKKLMIHEQIFDQFPKKFNLKLKQLVNKHKSLELTQRKFRDKSSNKFFNVVLFINANNQNAVDQATQVFETLFEGEFCNFNLNLQTRQYLSEHSRMKITNIQKKIDSQLGLSEKDYLFEFNNRKSQVVLYSQNRNKQLIKKRFHEILLNEQLSQLKINFFGKSLYGLLKDDQLLKRTLEKQGLSISIDYFKRNINVAGPQQKLIKAKEAIMHSFQNTTDQKSIKCSICYSSFTEKTFILLNCKHTFCTSCLRSMIFAVIADRAQFPIKCPQQGCKALLAIKQIEYFLQGKDYELLVKQSVSIYMDNNKDLLVQCPKIECNSAIISKSKQNFISCHVCNLQFCKLCKKDSHPLYNCQENLAMQKQFENIKGLKRCPKCKSPVLKNKGCNHIKCICGCHFCWICVKQFDQDVIYKHMSKQHQGYFDNQEQQRQANERLLGQGVRQRRPVGGNIARMYGNYLQE